MTEGTCPDLEVLFTDLAEGHGPALDHAKDCVGCAAVLEEHRQMEKDLFRLADPLPPPELVHQVMAKVAAAPAPFRVELMLGIGIFFATIAGALGLKVASGAGLGDAGTTVASAVVHGRAFLVGLSAAMEVVWKTAALPVAAILTVLIAFSLYGLKRMTGVSSAVDVKV